MSEYNPSEATQQAVTAMGLMWNSTIGLLVCQGYDRGFRAGGAHWASHVTLPVDVADRFIGTLVGVAEPLNTLTFAVDPETFHRTIPVQVWIEAR